MAKVYAPNKQYSGLSASVMFVKGVGETDNFHLLEWFESRGYEVEYEPEPKPEPVKEPEEPQTLQEPEPPAVEPTPEKSAKKGK
ncbi:hypothetical protein M5X17_10435 [Paenibacillus alvei]|uniref:hypothetical protein n=1 Tax=Paenibacillus alvei TaxID=44250 RepID=UPI00227FA0A2|nr:hypothetical protein [Paenibacillus alvei]MCY9734164.1 hypothetical protein [Paenibacillus alvei]